MSREDRGSLPTTSVDKSSCWYKARLHVIGWLMFYFVCRGIMPWNDGACCLGAEWSHVDRTKPLLKNRMQTLLSQLYHITFVCAICFLRVTTSVLPLLSAVGFVEFCRDHSPSGYSTMRPDACSCVRPRLHISTPTSLLP